VRAVAAEATYAGLATSPDSSPVLRAEPLDWAVRDLRLLWRQALTPKCSQLS